jgi:hypothetical protein
MRMDARAPPECSRHLTDSLQVNAAAVCRQHRLRALFVRAAGRPSVCPHADGGIALQPWHGMCTRRRHLR